MKKTIIIEILLLFVFAVLIACTSMAFIYVTNMNFHISQLGKAGLDNPDYQHIQEIIAYYKGNNHIVAAFAVPSLIAAISTLAVIIVIAIKDFPVFKPLLDKFATKKAEKQTAKAQQAAKNKQTRIEQLENELNELKKDE